MSDSLICGGPNAYVEWPVPGTETTVYASMEVFITTADLATLFSEHGGFVSSLGVIVTNTTTDPLHLVDGGPSGRLDSIEDDLAGFVDGSAGPGLGGAWHTLVWSIAPAVIGTYHIAIDADDQTYTYPFANGHVTSVKFGPIDQVDVQVCLGRLKLGTTFGGSDLLDYDPATDGDPGAFGFTVVGSVNLGECGSTPPPPPAPRFFEGYEWRFLFTAIDVTDPFNPDVMETTSWAQGLLTARRIAFSLGQATVIDAAVWPDDVRVNEIWTDGYPRVAPLKRMVWAFRRENPAGGPPWVCRACGILMSPQDEGDADVPLTHFTAYDPRKLLEGRPIMDAGGVLPGPNGFTIFDHGNVVALTYLKNTIENEGSVFIDAGPTWGGTSFYGGTIETTDEIDFTVQQGSSVADVWNQLEQSGNCDLILTAIYDPVNRPGYTHELSIYTLAGQERPSAVFAWDTMNRSVNKISRLHDQTPGAFFDKVQYYAGQGGPPVPATGPLVNAPALAAFGSVWSMQFFPTMTSIDPTGAAVLALAQQALLLAKQGRRTMTVEPTPERAPIPILAYGLGDRVPIYATKRLRVTADGYQRVESIPIQISDDGIETVGGLLCSPDWRGSP